MTDQAERTVTIDLEPIRWHGSPILTWLAAGIAWLWAGLLAIIVISGAAWA